MTERIAEKNLKKRALKAALVATSIVGFAGSGAVIAEAVVDYDLSHQRNESSIYRDMMDGETAILGLIGMAGFKRMERRVDREIPISILSSGKK